MNETQDRTQGRARNDARTMVEDFLARTLPFSDLDPAARARLAGATVVDFVPAGVRLLTQGESTVTELLLIQSGGVRLFLTGEEGAETLVDYRGEGASVGALALIRRSPANLTVETVEDSFLFRMDGAAFLEVLEANPGVARYYIERFSEDYISKAFGELRRRRLEPKSEASLYLVSTPVSELVRREPVRVAATANIREVAARMAEEQTGAALVEDGGGRVAGIVTDRDLRNKVLAQGLNYNWPVREIMSAPIVAVGPRTTCFNALLTMMRRQIHHLAVEADAAPEADSTAISGIITSDDILVLQGNSPFALYKEIVSEKRIAGLYELSGQVERVVRMLVAEGAKAANVGRMIAVLNDLIIGRMLTLLEHELAASGGPPPAPIAWLALGSEGRMEQTFKTDQDNALLVGQPVPEATRDRAMQYASRLGEGAVEHLIRAGYPPCPGKLMASNPQWRKDLAGWREFFDGLMDRPEPEAVLNASIFFDFRPVWGADAAIEAARELRERITRKAAKAEIFLRFLARDCLRTRPPLSFFKNFIVEKDGAHKNTLDLKLKGIAPLVDFARLAALASGVAETGTLPRLEGARDAGFLSEGLFSEVREAFSFLMQLRLVHQLRKIEAGRAPDNHLAPGDLTDLEKRTLKEAFGVVGAAQGLVRETYKLNV